MVEEKSTETPEPESKLRLWLRKWHVPTSPASWGVIGALAGALLSGGISYASAKLAADTSVRTVEAASAQSKTEFLRNQRLAEYTNFLTKSTKVEIAVYDYSTMLLASADTTYTPEERNAAYARLDSAQNEYIDASWRVMMIGTDAVVEVCGRMSSAVDETANKFRIRPNSPVDETLSTSQISDFGTTMAQLRNEFSTATRQEFLSPTDHEVGRATP